MNVLERAKAALQTQRARESAFYPAELIRQLVEALESEMESHVETAEILRRARERADTLTTRLVAAEGVAAERQELIDRLKAEKSVAVADAKYWEGRAQ